MTTQLTTDIYYEVKNDFFQYLNNMHENLVHDGTCVNRIKVIR